MAKPKSGKSRGVLNRQERTGNFGLSRFTPSNDAVSFVEHYWIVRWDLRGEEPFRQDVLSHPSVHLVFEHENTLIWGVVTGKFTRVLEGRGKVLGIKFRPAGFYPFLKKPIASFTDEVLSFHEVFGEDPKPLEAEILGSEEDESMVEKAESFLMQHLPDHDARIEEISGMVECIRDDISILRVDDLANRFEVSERTLQRLFRKYVGVTPKWVIQRYRLHEAAEKMASGEADDWPRLAMDLGYYDQSHFIRDFKAIVGLSPAEYAKSLGSKEED